MLKKIFVPDIGDFENVEIIEILVKKGDEIKKNDSIITLESDKSSVEVPADHEGIVEDIKVKIGDKVSKDDLLITLKSTVQLKEKTEKITEEKIPTTTIFQDIIIIIFNILSNSLFIYNIYNITII